MAHLWWENYFLVGESRSFVRLLPLEGGKLGSKRKKTCYKRIPQMNRVIVAEQGHGRHPPASRHAGGICHICIKEISKSIP